MLIVLNDYRYLSRKEEPYLLLTVETIGNGEVRYTYLSSRGHQGYMEVHNYKLVWNQYKDSEAYIPHWMKEIRSHLVEQQNK